MTKGEQARGERQGEDVCVCRDDRDKDRYGESVTVPIWVRRRRQRRIIKTEAAVTDDHDACKCKTQKVSCDKQMDVYESLTTNIMKQ